MNSGNTEDAKGDDKKWLRWLRWGVVACVWGYGLVLVGVWIFMLAAGDKWWPATLLLFGPRWLAGVPIVVLLPFMPLVRARYLWGLIAALLFVIFAIMGFELPAMRLFPPKGALVRVLTYNVAVDEVPAEALSALIAQVQPDIVALQECQPNDYTDVFRDWHVCHEGDLLVAARYPVTTRRTLMSPHPPHTWPRATMLNCTVALPDGPVQVATVHLPSPRWGLTAVVDRRTVINPRKRTLLAAETRNRDVVSERIAAQVADGDDDRIVLGDFNMPIESRLYRRDWAGYRNAFSEKGLGFGYTVRGEKRGWTVGIRIDHVLMHGRWQVARCWLGPDMGSDHRPVVAEIRREKIPNSKHQIPSKFQTPNFKRTMETVQKHCNRT